MEWRGAQGAALMMLLLPPHSTPPSIGVPIRVVGKNWHKRICYPAPFRSVLGRGSRSGSGRGTGPYRRMMQEQRAASRADKLMRFFMLHAWVWFMQLYVSIWAVEHVYETAWVWVTDNFWCGCALGWDEDEDEDKVAESLFGAFCFLLYWLPAGRHTYYICMYIWSTSRFKCEYRINWNHILLNVYGTISHNRRRSTELGKYLQEVTVCDPHHTIEEQAAGSAERFKYKHIKNIIRTGRYT